MNLVEIEERTIQGFITRTCNANEMDPRTSKIATLWMEFDNKIEVDYKNGNRVCGVYFDYESDANGEFSVLAGTDQSNINSATKIESIIIPKGKYLVFKAKGDIPKIVIETWAKVWEYFSQDDAEYKRLYTTDFEYYVSQNEIEVCIAVK